MNLYLALLERTAFMICTALIVMNIGRIHTHMNVVTLKGKLVFIITLSAFAISGNFLGVPIRTDFEYASYWLDTSEPVQAIVNTRSMGIVLAGLLGGPKLGFIVGFIAGVHRFSLGGFLAFGCLVSNVLQGLFAGLLKRWFDQSKRDHIAIQRAFIVSVTLECFHMIFLLFVARPLNEVIEIIQLIFIPQITINGIGIAIFFLLFFQIQYLQKKHVADYTRRGLAVANCILPQWKKPFSEAVMSVSRILLTEMEAVGVRFVGRENDMPLVGKQGSYTVLLPFDRTQEEKGYFLLYYDEKSDQQLGQAVVDHGLIELFQYQYAFIEKEEKERLLMNAELKALQAQMNPHFLFNALNTIRAMIRVQPNEAREMITELGKFLRQTVQKHDTFISLEAELAYVESYYKLMKARHGDQVVIDVNVPNELMTCFVPPLSIQPLVENAIQHGFRNRNGFGKVHISAQKCGEFISIVVSDNGEWKERQEKNEEAHLGFALDHLQKRLQLHFGGQGILHIQTNDNGTTVSFTVRSE